MESYHLVRWFSSEHWGTHLCPYVSTRGESGDIPWAPDHEDILGVDPPCWGHVSDQNWSSFGWPDVTGRLNTQITRVPWFSSTTMGYSWDIEPTWYDLWATWGEIHLHIAILIQKTKFRSNLVDPMPISCQTGGGLLMFVWFATLPPICKDIPKFVFHQKRKHPPTSFGTGNSPWKDRWFIHDLTKDFHGHDLYGDASHWRPTLVCFPSLVLLCHIHIQTIINISTDIDFDRICLYRYFSG
jgi:hypothetical protein